MILIPSDGICFPSMKKYMSWSVHDSNHAIVIDVYFYFLKINYWLLVLNGLCRYSLNLLFTANVLDLHICRIGLYFRFWDIFQDVGLPVWYPDQGIKSVCWTLWADNSAICLGPLQPLCYVRSDGSLPYLSLSLSLCCVQCNMWITISICNIYKILHIFRNLCKKRSAFLYLVDFFFLVIFFHCIHFNFFFFEKRFLRIIF